MGVPGGDERPLTLVRTCQLCDIALDQSGRNLPTALLATRDAIAR